MRELGDAREGRHSRVHQENTNAELHRILILPKVTIDPNCSSGRRDLVGTRSQGKEGDLFLDRSTRGNRNGKN